MNKYCFVSPEDYASNLKAMTNNEFTPSIEVEIKKDRPIENIYRDLYDTSRLYPETENYKAQERTM